MLIPTVPNDRWSLDFVSDQLIDCRRFRILTIVDSCTRESLALVADTSLSGVRLAPAFSVLTFDATEFQSENALNMNSSRSGTIEHAKGPGEPNQGAKGALGPV